MGICRTDVCCTVAGCSLLRVCVCVFLFFNLCSLFFLPLPFPPSLAWPTDFSSHRFNPPQAPRPIPTWGIDTEYTPSDDLGHSAPCWSLCSKAVPWVIIVSSLAIAWCPNDESSEPMFFYTSSSLGSSSLTLSCPTTSWGVHTQLSLLLLPQPGLWSFSSGHGVQII